MLIDLTPNELMWINDMCARECIRGRHLVENLKDCEGHEEMAVFKAVCDITSAIADLGLKICSALEKWQDEHEKKNEEDGEGVQDGQ